MPCDDTWFGLPCLKFMYRPSDNDSSASGTAVQIRNEDTGFSDLRYALQTDRRNEQVIQQFRSLACIRATPHTRAIPINQTDSLNIQTTNEYATTPSFFAACCCPCCLSVFRS